MITITGYFYLVIYYNWINEVWSQEIGETIYNDIIKQASTVKL